jgi:hypothetical protein
MHPVVQSSDFIKTVIQMKSKDQCISIQFISKQDADEHLSMREAREQNTGQKQEQSSHV